MDEFIEFLKVVLSSLDKISVCLCNKNYVDNTRVLLDYNDDENSNENTNENTNDNNNDKWTKLSVEDTITCMVLSLNLCEHLFSKFLFSSSSSSSSSSLSSSSSSSSSSSTLRELYIQLSYDIHSLKSFIYRTHKSYLKKGSSDSNEMTAQSTAVCTSLDDISTLISIRIILIDILTLLHYNNSNTNGNIATNSNIPTMTTIITSLDKYTNDKMIRSNNNDTRNIVTNTIIEGKALSCFLKARQYLLSYSYPDFISMNEKLRQYILLIEQYNNTNDSSILKWLKDCHAWLKEMMIVIFSKIRNQVTRKFNSSSKPDDIAIVNNAINNVSKHINNGIVHIAIYSKGIQKEKAFTCPPRSSWTSSTSSSIGLTSPDESGNDNVIDPIGWHPIFSQINKKGKVMDAFMSEISLKTETLPATIVDKIEADYSNDQIYVDQTLSKHGTEITDSVGGLGLALGLGNNSPKVTRSNQSIIAVTSLSDKFTQNFYIIKVSIYLQIYDNNNVINVNEVKSTIINSISTFKSFLCGNNLYCSLKM